MSHRKRWEALLGMAKASVDTHDISVDVYELAVHQSNSRGTPSVRSSKRTLPKKGKLPSHRQSFDHNQFDHNQTVNKEPPSVQPFRHINNIGPINQDALRS